MLSFISLRKSQPVRIGAMIGFALLLLVAAVMNEPRRGQAASRQRQRLTFDERGANAHLAPPPERKDSPSRPPAKPPRRRSQTSVVTVSAASYGAEVAPDSIVAAFGTRLATQTVVATDADPNTPGIQLPTELGGTTVEVNGRRAGLFFVSPAQVNYVIPAATEAGAANVVVRAGDGAVANGSAQISAATPAIFTANGSGQGPPAGAVLRVRTDGSQIFEPLAEFSPATGVFTPRPINLGPAGERVFLILNLTGLRGAVDANSDGNVNETIHVLLGGDEVAPAFAGAQGTFVGLDQINVEIPRSMSGRGAVNVAVNYSTLFASNVARIEIAGVAPVSISDVAPATATAGGEIIINGAGFAASVADNQVFIVDAQEQPVRAKVTSASVNQLRALVPFGAGSGRVLVRTPAGEALSATTLTLRTSISGFVTDANARPLPGVIVRLLGASLSATTTAEGVFLLADVPAGAAQIEVDATGLITAQPFPKITLPLAVRAGRDNQFPNAISLSRSASLNFNADEASVETDSQTADPAQQSATITGLVVESDGVSPAPHALAVANGRAVFTDNLGRYVLAGVTGATAALDAAALRPDGRVDRASNPSASLSLPAGGVRVAPNLTLQSPAANRPPVLIAPTALAVNPGATLNLNFIASDPDPGQTVQVNIAGPAFASVSAVGGYVYSLRIAPGANDGGPFTLTLTARDNQNATATQTVALRVNRPPTANAQTVTTTEAVARSVTLTGSDPDGDTLQFTIVTQPTRGTLTGSDATRTYIPALGFSGADSFTFKASDGLLESAAATVTINVAAISDTRRATPLSAGVSVLMPGAAATGASTVAPLSAGVSVLMPGGAASATSNVAPLSGGVSVLMPGGTTSAATNVAPLSSGVSVLMPGGTTSATTNVAPLSAGVSVLLPSATASATTNIAPLSSGVSVQFAAPPATGSATVAPLSNGVSVQLNPASGASGNLNVAPLSPGVSVQTAPANTTTHNIKAKGNTRGKPPP